ncbi:MAG: stage III sporulation protein AA [Alicyclobacillus sp.]|nr:stage III sporulation protein AA [Alicyclobacillus sp.]
MAVSSQTDGPHRQPAWHSVLAVFPPDIRTRLENLPSDELRNLEEIRLRLGRPVHLVGQRIDAFLGADAGWTVRPEHGLTVTADHLQRVVQAVTQASMYAVEEDVRRGFVTMPGGHRVGLAGRVVIGPDGSIRALRSVSSVNVRLASERIGSATPILPHTFDAKSGRPLHLLLLSPPQCGKTTLLRDLARAWSCGQVGGRRGAAKVVVVDERSEIAGSIDGIAQFDLGPRTDVLDGCPKAEGVMLAIRSLSPEVVVTDEIGRPEDAQALLEAVHAGVAVFASAHANSLADWAARPSMQALRAAGAFQRYVVLSRRRGPATVERVLDSGGRAVWERGMQL